MKSIVQGIMLVSLLGLFLLAVGCTTTVKGTQITEQEALEKIKTRDDAIRILGAPDNIAPYGDSGNKLYTFVSGLGSGGGFGIGYMAWQLILVGSDHFINDSFLVLVDKNNRVIKFKELESQHIRTESAWGARWPGGD